MSNSLIKTGLEYVLNLAAEVPGDLEREILRWIVSFPFGCVYALSGDSDLLSELSLSEISPRAPYF